MAIRYKAGSDALFLGRQGENLAREIEFDISDWVETFGEGTVQALHRRDNDAAPYPLNPTFSGGKAIWLVTDADTAYAGSGECELRYTVNDVLVKSRLYRTTVAPSLEGELSNPEALPDWVANVLAVGESIKRAEILNHIRYVESMDKDNPLCIRDLDSGTYILRGYFKPVAAVTQKFTFSTDMLVSIVKFTSTSYVQVFYSKDNAIQYLMITDETFTRKDAKLVNMESVANKVTTVDENSDDDHYPTAKAVYEAIQAALAEKGL